MNTGGSTTTLILLVSLKQDDNVSAADYSSAGDVPPPDDSINVETGFKFDRLGVRVPTIAISPYIAKGVIVNPQTLPDRQADLPSETSAFDSTSIMATANKLLGVSAKPMGDRSAWAASFTSILQASPRGRQTKIGCVFRLLLLSADDCIEKLPEIPAADAGAYAAQRRKPLNHHLEAQLLFYCRRNNAALQEQELCLDYVKQHIVDQGTASDWIMEQVQ
jgi:hypothetical protein